jgi:hypothetical protein
MIQPYTDALVAAVAAATPDDVFVTDGPPPAALLQAGQVVWVGDVAGAQNTIALGDSADEGPKNEEFSLQMHVSIYGPTTANATNTHSLQGNQAFGIFETIDQTIRSDPEMGLTDVANPRAYVRFAEVRGPVVVRKGGNDQARETTVSFAVFVFGFLDPAA